MLGRRVRRNLNSSVMYFVFFFHLIDQLKIIYTLYIIAEKKELSRPISLKKQNFKKIDNKMYKDSSFF